LLLQAFEVTWPGAILIDESRERERARANLEIPWSKTRTTRKTQNCKKWHARQVSADISHREVTACVGRGDRRGLRNREGMVAAVELWNCGVL